MSTKDDAITRTAGELRLSDSEVRMVVNAYEAARSAVNRAARKPKVRVRPKAKPKAAPKTATYKGGGYYQLSTGRVVKGKGAIPKGYEISGG